MTTYRNPKDDDSRVQIEPNPHVCSTANYGNRIITAVAECHHRPATRCDAELSRFAVDCFLNAIDKVILTTSSTDEVILCLERGMLVTQERVRDHMVTSQDEDLALTVTAILQLRHDVTLPSSSSFSSLSSSSSSSSTCSSSSSSMSSSISSATTSTSGSRGGGGGWVVVSLGMPNAPVPLIIDSHTKDITACVDLTLSSLSSLSSSEMSHSLSTFRLEKLWCSVIPCAARSIVAFINSDAVVTLDPVYLNKSPKNYFPYDQWNLIPDQSEANRVRRESSLGTILHIWKKSNGQIDRFADEVIHKIVSIQKMRGNITLEQNPAPLHALFTALRVSRASLSPQSRPSLLPSSSSPSLQWEICRIIPRDTSSALSDYFSIIRNLLSDRIGPLPQEKEEEGESLHEFFLCVSPPSLEFKIRWSDRLRSFLLSVRGLVRSFAEVEGEREGGRGGVCGWTREVGEMVLMNWQKPENLFSVILDTFGKQENGVSQKKMRAFMREGFSTFNPKEKIAEIIGKRRRMRLATLSPILGILSGDLEIIITDFRVSFDSQSFGEYRSYVLQSSKVSYLSSFADNFFSLLGISSSNTSMSHFLLSLPSATGEGRTLEDEEGEEEASEETYVFETVGVDSDEEEEEGVPTAVLEDELDDYRNMYGEIMISEPKAEPS